MTDAYVGMVGVWLAFAASIIGALVIVAGLVRQRAGAAATVGPNSARLTQLIVGSRQFAPVMLLGAVVATGAMEHALVTHDFTLVFVAQNNSVATPLLYSITGLWSALAGSILLWGLALTAFTVVFCWRYRHLAADPVIRWATLVLYLVNDFLFGMMVL